MVGTQDYAFSDVRLDDGDVMSSFLGQFYGRERERQIPDEVLTPEAIGDDGALASLLLREAARRKVAVRAPQRGALLELVGWRRATPSSRSGAAPRGARERRHGARGAAGAALAARASAPRRGLRRLDAARHADRREPRVLRGRPAAASRTTAATASARRRRTTTTRPCARCSGAAWPGPTASRCRTCSWSTAARGSSRCCSAALADAGLAVDAVGLSKERDAGQPFAAGAPLRWAEGRARVPARTPRSRAAARRARAACSSCSGFATSRTASPSSSSARCARSRTSPRSWRSCPASVRRSGGRCCASWARCARCAPRPRRRWPRCRGDLPGTPPRSAASSTRWPRTAERRTEAEFPKDAPVFTRRAPQRRARSGTDRFLPLFRAIAASSSQSGARGTDLALDKRT